MNLLNLSNTASFEKDRSPELLDIVAVWPDFINMADKEATVYIVDVGRSMGEMNNGRVYSDLDWAMLYVWDRITTTVWELTTRLSPDKC